MIRPFNADVIFFSSQRQFTKVGFFYNILLVLGILLLCLRHCLVFQFCKSALRMKSSHSNRLCCLFQCARVWSMRHLGMKSSRHHVGRICASIMHARVVARGTDSTISDGMFHQPHDHIDRSPSSPGRYRSIGVDIERCGVHSPQHGAWTSPCSCKLALASREPI